MIRISIPWLIDAVGQIEELSRLPSGSNRLDLAFKLYAARERLQSIFGSSIYSDHLRISFGPALELVETIKRYLSMMEDPSNEIPDYEFTVLKVESEKFKNIFMSELASIPLYIVASKDAYHTDTLLLSGHKLFPKSLIQKVPESKSDVEEAAKALAFELPTACGFHVFRVVEIVLRKYWDHVSNQEERPNSQTIGAFTSALESKGIGDKKIVETLRQISKLHRNPIAHPETILSVEEAIGIVGIARSVIAQMLDGLPFTEPTISRPAPPLDIDAGLIQQN